MTLINKYPAKKLLLVFILVAAALLRLHHIQQPFVDVIGWREASTAMMAKNFYAVKMNIFYPQVDWGGPGPNYQGREFQTLTFVTAILYKGFGEHEWVGRLVAVLFGLWGTFCFYKIVEKVWDIERALVCTAILAILPGAVFLDRSFVPDPVMVSLMLTCLWLLAAYCESGKRYLFLFSVLAGCLGLLTKINGAVLCLPASYLIWNYFGRRYFNRERILMHVGLPIIAVLIVLSYYLWANHLASTGTTKHFAGSGKFLTSLSQLREWISHKYFLRRTYQLLQQWMWTTPVILLSIVGIISLPKTNNKARWFFHLWACALFIQYIVEAEHLVEDPQNLQMFNPLGAALAGSGLVYISSLFKKFVSISFRRIAVTFMVIIIAIIGRVNLKWYYFPYNEAAYKLGLDLNRIADKKDLMISFGLNPVSIYYSGKRGWVFPPAAAWDNNEYKQYGPDDVKLIEDLRTQGAKWLLISKENDYTLIADKKLLQQRYPQMGTHLFSNYKSIIENEYGMVLDLQTSYSDNVSAKSK